MRVFKVRSKYAVPQAGVICLAFVFSASANLVPSHPTCSLWDFPRQQGTQADHPAKKVWTNDEIEGLRKTQPVSVVGQEQSAGIERTTGNEDASTTKAPYDPNRDPSVYAAQAKLLQAKLDLVDAELTQFQESLKRGSEPIRPPDSPPPPPSQIPDDKRSLLSPNWNIGVLQGLKKGLQEQMDKLQAKARLNGLPPVVERPEP